MPVTDCHIEFADGTSAKISITFSNDSPWTLAVEVPGMGRFTTQQRDLFDALLKFREWLATNGAIILVQGAARHVYPSGMQREMGGRQAYRCTPGKRAERADVTDIFASAERSEIVTIEQQRANFDAWVHSIEPKPADSA